MEREMFGGDSGVDVSSVNFEYCVALAKSEALTYSQMIYIVDRNFKEANLLLLARDDIPGAVYYRMSSFDCDELNLIIAKKTKSMSVLHRLMAESDCAAVIDAVQHNLCVSSYTLSCADDG